MGKKLSEAVSKVSKGKLLVAMPKLNDPNFRQTVILLCEYGPDGALGVVLNRPTEMAVSMLMDGFQEEDGEKKVYVGGPVARNGMLILCRSEETPYDSHSVFDGVFVPKDLEKIKTAGALGASGEVRCFLGYAGWAPGQLEDELSEGAWSLMPSDATLVFDADPSFLWAQMMRRLGDRWSFYATMPADPSLN
ncbi:MAG: YqgE/AlgH family protein [Nitrospiria bacterium]